MQGWIKLNRDILESKIFANPNDLKIWIWLMCKASTVDRFVSLKIGKGSTTVELKRGQMIFGRHKAEQDLKIDGSTIYRTLQRFADEQAIFIKANNQFSIITVNDFIESQTFAEVENFEIEEIEQPMNNQSEQVRTTNEQPTNKQRATNEQPTNTVKEGLESKEGLEFSESKKSKEEHAQAVNGSAGHVNGKLFEELEPLKTGKGKKENEAAPQKEKSLYVQFIDVYDHWFKNLNDCPPKITAADGSAAKSLIQYFKKDANDRAAKAGEILDEKTESARVVESWTVFLQNWNLLDNFSQARTRIVDINSNLQNLIIQIRAKYGTNNNSTGTGNNNGRQPIASASHKDIINAINKNFGD